MIYIEQWYTTIDFIKTKMPKATINRSCHDNFTVYFIVLGDGKRETFLVIAI